MASIKFCPNCNAVLSGDYCAKCGQLSSTEIAVKPLIISLIEKTTELDFRFVRTVKELFTRPGRMIKDYLEGKRIIYSNPFKMLFYTATIYFVVITLFDIRLDFANKDTDSGRAVAAFINYLLFFFLAFASFLLSLLYRKHQLNWAKCFIILCYAWSGYLLLTCLLAMLSRVIPLAFEISRLVIAPIYLVFVFKPLFEQSWPLTILKSLLFYVGYIICSMLVMSAVIACAYWLDFEPLMITFSN
jgi:hypothetical protein